MVTKFQNFHKTGVPYITIPIQGMSLNMIIDTGCEVNLISQNVLNLIPFQKSSRVQKLTALTSDSIDSETVSLAINIDGREIMEDFMVIGDEDPAHFKIKYGVIIHGFLGTEFFKAAKGCIDYDAQTVTFS